MKYFPIERNLFIKNRAKFIAEMKPQSIAFFNSNDIYPISADSTMPFAQHRDIFYLSGIDQEESILVLFPNAIDEKHREILFLKETSELIAIWEGEKLTKEKAFETSGIPTVYWLDEFDKIIYGLMHQAETVYYNINEHYRAEKLVETREDRFIKQFKTQYPLHKIERSNPILQKIRAIKEPEEINLIQKACNITHQGFERVLKFIKPRVTEFEIEAEFAHEFIRNRSKGFAYSPIIASGKNACVLHYIENNQPCKAGDMILMDVAAEYANYSSDMTRTVPVSGRFTARQRDIYNAVLRVKKEAEKILVAGNVMKAYHEEIGKIMTSELLRLKLIDKADVQNEDPKWPAYKKYFMHGTSHHMGLDTHDYGDLQMSFAENMVFTIEPAIYIPEENIGIRLEDNYVIQKSGAPFNLMQNIPIEMEEIEDRMNKN